MGCGRISWTLAQGFQILIWRCATDSPREMEWALVSGGRSVSSTSLVLNPQSVKAHGSQLPAGDRLQ